MRRARLVYSLLVSGTAVAVGIIALVDMQRYPVIARRYPMFVAILVVALCLVDVLRSASEVARSRRESTASGIRADPVENPPSGNLVMAKYIVALIAYVVLLKGAGFLLASFLLMISFPFILGERYRWQGVIVAAGVVEPSTPCSLCCLASRCPAGFGGRGLWICPTC